MADRSTNCVNCCTLSILCLAIIWMSISVIFLIYSGDIIVGPYKTYSKWNTTECLLKEVEHKGMAACSCGGDCTAEYPCYHLKVIYSFSGEHMTSSLFYSSTDLEDESQVRINMQLFLTHCNISIHSPQNHVQHA